jgi:hypothetical protein
VRSTPGRARAPALLGLAVLVVYVLTLYPDVAGGDSGELTGAVFTGGVIHPPGYPLYELLGRVFLHVPHGSIAWRMNFLSACCDAAAAGVLCAAVTAWTGSRAGGIVAGALFAASPGIWQYAICAEVFALDNLCIALLLLCAAKYAAARDPRWLLAGPLVAGLGMSNHQTILLTAAPLAVWVIWFDRAFLLRPRPLAVLAGFFAIGLLPYLYLPIAASRHAAITWGAADTWSGFWAHVLRREYGTFQLAPSGIAGASDGGKTAAAFAADALEQLGWWGLPLAALGLVAVTTSRRLDRGLAVATIAAPALAVGVMAWLGNLPVTDLLHRGIVARFWQQPEMYLCAWCGAGVAWLEARAPARHQRWASIAFAASLSIVPLAVRFPEMDRHHDTLVRSYGAEILRAAPPGALLVTKGDLITSPVRYLQAAERARPDVRVVDQELLGLPWYDALVTEAHPEITLPGPRFMPGAPDGFTMKQLLDANVDRAPVLVCGGVKPPDVTADASYGRWPMGLCEEVHKGTEPVNLDGWVRESGAALPRIDFGGQAHPPGSWEDIVWGDAWEVQNTRAAHLINVAGADPSRRRYLAMAADMLQDLVEENPDEPPRVYKTLAIALGRAGLETPEERARAADAWRRYLAVAPPDDPMLPAIHKELERLTQ